MTTESFKEIYASCTPLQKLDLLIENESYRRLDAVHAEHARMNRNNKEEEYWRSEEKHMINRIFWLYTELCNALAPREANVIELKDAQMDEVYWVEWADTARPCPIALMEYHTDEIDNYYVDWYGSDAFEKSKYLFDGDGGWRLWSSKPTREQMEETPWG